ncbi:hypothetical protein WNY37_03545 [Henriciella sp. AS95]|uniref:hypothetical protein n=1 Tax=Henriciella sp. AS95 TaxID=3135782 RepID=UPI00316C1C46
MKHAILLSLTVLALAACQGSNCSKAKPTLLTASNAATTAKAAEDLALNEVYTRHPSRALVDIATARRRSIQPSVYEVHVEMTGSPEARAIYDVIIGEDEDGEMIVTGFTKVQ